MICRYPVPRLLGAACALVLYIAAGVFYGYSGRLVPLGAILASVFPGTELLPDQSAPARYLRLVVSSMLDQSHCNLGEVRALTSPRRHVWRSAASEPPYLKGGTARDYRCVWACGVCN